MFSLQFGCKPVKVSRDYNPEWPLFKEFQHNTLLSNWEQTFGVSLSLVPVIIWYFLDISFLTQTSLWISTKWKFGVITGREGSQSMKIGMNKGERWQNPSEDHLLPGVLCWSLLWAPFQSSIEDPQQWEDNNAWELFSTKYPLRPPNLMHPKKHKWVPPFRD